MGRIFLAIRCFFSILLRGKLPEGALPGLGLEAGEPPARPAEPAKATDGALQILAILQRDARLVDFLMEDISEYSDEQVGAAVRGLHGQCRQALSRYVRLAPVIDGVEGSFTRFQGDAEPLDPARVKLLGNVPAEGAPEGGLLRHKGWRAEKVELPPLDPRDDHSIVARAEIEIE